MLKPGLWSLSLRGDSQNRRGEECGPFPIMYFAFIYICGRLPVWGHLSLNSWKQAVYSRALSQNALTLDPWCCRGWLLPWESSSCLCTAVSPKSLEGKVVLYLICIFFFLDHKACQFLTHDHSHSLQASVRVD